MARRIMDQLRGELYLDQRYLNAALGALPPAPLPPGTTGAAFAADGARLCYPPAWVLATYRKNRRYLPRAYLHSVLHCIFRHLWLRGGRDRTLWGLACDIAVENTLDNLNTPATTRPVGWLRQQAYQQLQNQCGLLAAGPVYRVLRECDEETLTRWLREFTCDDHRFWPADPDSPQAQMQGKQWEQLGRQTQLSMEESGRHAGENAGARTLQAQVQASRSRRSYRDFLRRFAVWHEEPHLDPEEFDLGFYSYGLRVYGNLPLIEPLESREVKKDPRLCHCAGHQRIHRRGTGESLFKGNLHLIKKPGQLFPPVPYFGAAGGQCHPGRDLADRSGRTGPLHRPFYAAWGRRHRLPPRVCPHCRAAGARRAP